MVLEVNARAIIGMVGETCWRITCDSMPLFDMGSHGRPAGEATHADAVDIGATTSSPSLAMGDGSAGLPRMTCADRGGRPACVVVCATLAATEIGERSRTSATIGMSA